MSLVEFCTNGIWEGVFFAKKSISILKCKKSVIWVVFFLFSMFFFRFPVAEVAPPLTKETVKHVHRPHHNRQRRGGVADATAHSKRSTPPALKPAGLIATLNELELKARTPPGEKFSQLQSLPDAILAISTPSS